MGRDEFVAQADQLEKRAVELDDVVLGAPRMAVQRADLKAEPAIELGLLGQGVSGDDQMVDGARHGRAPQRRPERPLRRRRSGADPVA